MSKGKRIAIGLAFLVLAAVILLLARPFLFKTEIISSVPKDADMVAYLNMDVLLRQSLHRDSSKIRLNRNEYILAFLQGGKSGVDYLADAVFVRHQDVSYILLRVKDEESLTASLAVNFKKLVGKANVVGDYKTARGLKDSFTLAWNKNLLAIFPGTKTKGNPAFINSILSVSREESFTEHPDFDACKQDAAMLWFYVRKHDNRLPLPSPLKGFVMYDTTLRIFATDNMKAPQAETEFFTVQGNPAEQTIYCGLPSGRTQQALTDLCKLYVPAAPGEPLPGPKVLMLFPPITRQEEKVSYVFDENFEKKEVRTTYTDTIRPANIVFYSSIKSHLSNPDSYAARFVPEFPAYVGIYADITEDMLKPVYPPRFPYHLKLVQENRLNHLYYRMDIRLGNWSRVLNSFMGS